MQSAKSVIFHLVLTTTRACFDACRVVGLENNRDRNSLTLLTTLIGVVKAILGIGLGGTSHARAVMIRSDRLAHQKKLRDEIARRLAR